MVMSSRPTPTEIFVYQVKALFSGTPRAVLVHAINAIILVVVLQEYVNHTYVVMWSLALAVVMAVRVLLHKAFERTAPNVEDIKPWMRAMLVAIGLTGLVWGVAAWVFMPPQSVEHQLFTAMIMIVISTGAIGNLYPVLAAYPIFVTPVIVLFMARFVIIGTTLHFAMAVSAFILLGILVFFAKRHRDELMRTLELRAENKTLLERLSQENAEVRSENDEMQRMETLLRQKSAVLDAVSKIQGFFIADHDPTEVFDKTLDTILDLTGSEYGFIGEVCTNKNEAPYLKAFAITDISWNEETQHLYQQQKSKGLEFHNLNTLFGSVLSNGEPVISNDPMHDPRRGGLPPGHPPLNAFLGVPLYMGDDIVGMFGIANREGGYDNELLTALEPVISATARMVEALQSRRAREDTQNQLEEAKELAEKANLAKTEFLSSMSHELRTPMNAVLGFAQLLQLNPQVSLHPKQADSVEQIIKAGHHLMDLINEILDLSRIEAGRVSLTLEDVDPYEVMRDCIAYISPLAERRGIALTAHIPSSDQMVIRTDRVRFRQVLLNLLSNAVKYNVDDGTVTLSVQMQGHGMVRFCVSDTGPGIAQDQQEEIFEPFSRLGAESTEIEGTGIGLTISRFLMELMGGQLDFKSEVGKGSEFWVDFPGSTQDEVVTEEKFVDTDLSQLPSGSHTVLYIEDNPDNLRLMEHVISMIDNAQLISAHTGELGLEMADIHHPDIILMDISLPGINGIEALHRLREKPNTKSIPVIAISAAAMADDVEQGLKEGFDAYLTKPININVVIDHISQALAGTLETNKTN